jgi:FkbM family methyltransferase
MFNPPIKANTSSGGENRAEGDVDLRVFRRFFRGTPNNGLMVDVGAARPDFLSVSAYFRQRGWRVIAIEPNPAFVDLHRALNHEVYPYACGDHDEDGVSFCLVDSHGTNYEEGKVSFESFSSLAIKDSYAALKPNLDVTKIQVDLRKLDTILAKHAPEAQEIDILSVDVEGWELEVIRGLNFERYRPKVLILENLFDDPGYVTAMLERRYHRWSRIYPNDVYVRSGFDGTGINPHWGRFTDFVSWLFRRL